MKRKAIILHDKISYKPFRKISIDDYDNTIQKKVIRKSLRELGFKTSTVSFDLQLTKKNKFKSVEFVFNIVESVNGGGAEIFRAPLFLQNLGVKFTGGNSQVIKQTTDKIETKMILDYMGVRTSPWTSLIQPNGFIPDMAYIVKPINEDASIGIVEDSVYKIQTIQELEEILLEKKKLYGKDYFAEIYIDGREFNISVINNNGNPLVLPPAELVFSNYEKGRYKVASYRAKWDENSFEYKNTNRTFDFADRDKELLKKMEDITIKCWELFNLKGYARVDFRVDENNNPWVLEINVNPCISPDSGFIAAANKKGLTYKDVISSIINDLN